MEKSSASLMPTAFTRTSTACQTSRCNFDWLQKICETLMFQGQCDRRVLWSSDRRRMPADLSVPWVSEIACNAEANTLFVVHQVQGGITITLAICLHLWSESFATAILMHSSLHSECVMFTWFDHLEETFPSSCFLYNRSLCSLLLSKWDQLIRIRWKDELIRIDLI